MLKIKDRIDLEELEKFGFEKLEDWFKEELKDDKNCWKVDEIEYIADFGCGCRRGQTYYIYVSENRELFVNSTSADGSGCETEVDSVVFDLIQAGLIEKVDY